MRKGIISLELLLGVMLLSFSLFDFVKPPNKIPTPSQSPQISIIHDKSKWKTYFDPLYNYTIKYPPSWKVVQYNEGKKIEVNRPLYLEKGIFFMPRKAPQLDAKPLVEIYATTAGEFKSVEDILNERVYTPLGKNYPLQRKKVKIGGFDADEVIGLPGRWGERMQVMFIGDTIFYFYSSPYGYSAWPESSLDEAAQVFELMLSTFQYPVRRQTK